MKTKKNISDGDVLIQSIKRPWMFAILVDKYQKKFLRKSIQILKSKEASEDAVQDAFLKIYKNASKFAEREGNSFNAWAFRILVNTCYDELERRRSENLEYFDFADLDTVNSSVDQDVSTVSYVQSILKKMPENLSRFLRLYFFDEKSQKEIAEEEGMTELAVRSRIHRAKKYFKKIATQITW